MKLLSGSGASTRGAGVGSALVAVAKQYPFNVFVGVSYSAVVAVPLALGMYDDIVRESMTLTHNKFFDISPVNKKGGISFGGVMRGLGSLFAPKQINSFGVQNVQKILKKFVTKELFEEYQQGMFPKVYICAVNVATQEAELFDLQDRSIDYQMYLDIVSASSRIPVWTQPQEVKGQWYYDGGVTDTNASALVLKKHPEIKECVSVYPRPEDFAGKAVPCIDGIVGAINWTIDTMIKDVSKNDVIQEKDICFHNGIKLTQIFLPYVLKSIYDVDKKRLLELAHKSKIIAEQSIQQHI